MIDEEEIRSLCARLRHTDLFHALTDDELRLVAFIGQRRKVAAGERLAHAGSRGSDIYTIFEGELRLLTGNTPEDETTVRLAHPGETVPLAAILDPPVLVTSVEASSDGEVFDIPRGRLTELCEIQPMLGIQVYRAAATAFEQRYRKTLDDLVTSLRSVLQLAHRAR